MRFPEYQMKASRTLLSSIDATYTDRDTFLAWYALGLCGETSELSSSVILYNGMPERRDVVISEAGDVLWYVAAILTTLDLSMGQLPYTYNQKPPSITDSLYSSLAMLRDAGEIADIVKKGVFHRQGLTEWYVGGIIERLRTIVNCVSFIVRPFDCDLIEIMDCNIAKIAERYPNGYTPERSKH